MEKQLDIENKNKSFSFSKEEENFSVAFDAVKKDLKFFVHEMYEKRSSPLKLFWGKIIKGRPGYYTLETLFLDKMLPKMMEEINQECPLVFVDKKSASHWKDIGFWLQENKKFMSHEEINEISEIFTGVKSFFNNISMISSAADLKDIFALKCGNPSFLHHAYYMAQAYWISGEKTKTVVKNIDLTEGENKILFSPLMVEMVNGNLEENVKIVLDQMYKRAKEAFPFWEERQIINFVSSVNFETKKSNNKDQINCMFFEVEDFKATKSVFEKMEKYLDSKKTEENMKNWLLSEKRGKANNVNLSENELNKKVKEEICDLFLSESELIADKVFITNSTFKRNSEKSYVKSGFSTALDFFERGYIIQHLITKNKEYFNSINDKDWNYWLKKVIVDGLGTKFSTSKHSLVNNYYQKHFTLPFPGSPKFNPYNKKEIFDWVFETPYKKTFASFMMKLSSETEKRMEFRDFMPKKLESEYFSDPEIKQEFSNLVLDSFIEYFSSDNSRSSFFIPVEAFEYFEFIKDFDEKNAMFYARSLNELLNACEEQSPLVHNFPLISEKKSKFEKHLLLFHVYMKNEGNKKELDKKSSFRF